MLGLAARRVCLLALLPLVAGGARAADFWPGLWRNADQRGEQLLRQGDAAAAARTYADPRRRGYAELQAGDYPAAARDFAAFDDGDAHYNRGNALARAGDLAAALKAYDTALARDPDNRDARHNRDLVAQALKRQPPQPPASSSGQGQSGKRSKGSDKGTHQGATSPGKQAGEGQDGQPGRDRHDDKPGSKPEGKPSGKPGDQGQGGAQAERSNPVDSAGAGNGRNRQQQPGGNDADQARRDAEAGLGRQANRNTGDRNATPGRGEAAAKADRAAPREAQRSEQQLAREQWLRQIPDDPGGLLRRKFMIEHLMRQQGNQP